MSSLIEKPHQGGPLSATRRPFSKARWSHIGISLLGAFFALSACNKNKQPTVALALVNGSFESQTNDIPSGWSLPGNVRTKGTLNLDSTITTDGVYALRLEPNETNTAGSALFGVGQSLNLSPHLSSTLQIEAWLGAEGDTEAVLGIQALAADGEKLEHIQLKFSSEKKKLKQLRRKLKIPKDQQASKLIIYAISVGNSGAAYFDGIVLRQEVAAKPSAKNTDAGAASPVPSSTASAFPSPVDVTATIHTNDPIRTIPSQLFGTNLTWKWNGFGTWLPRKNDFNPSVLTHTKAIQPTLLRFPGGTFGDYYDWRKAIGPQQKRTPMSPVPGEKPENPLLGTDEALRFARAVGGQLLIVVNAGTGTPEMAAEWVRYINQVKAKEDPKHYVKYWEIGNELYHKPGKQGAAKGKIYLTPEQYADKFIRIAKAMRAVDPSIKLGAIGLENFGRYRFNSFPNWNKQVLQRIGTQIDFFSQHNAYAPVGAPDSTSFQDGYNALLAAPLGIRRNLATVAAQLKQHVPTKAKDIPLAITEWGPMFHTFHTFRWLDHSKTLGAALFVASMMKVFIETPQVQIANQFKLVDFTFNGLLGISQRTRVNKDVEYDYRPTAPYYAFKRMMKHKGQTLVRTNTKSPTFDSENVGWTAALRNVPSFEIVASINQDRTTLLITAINKSEMTARAKISLEGFDAAQEGTINTMTGDGLGAHTGTGPVQVPRIQFATPVTSKTNPQHDKGQPEAIRQTTKQLELDGRSFSYRFPALSISTIEIPAGR